MKGVNHWAVSDDRALLFDTVASELPLLDVTDTRLMEQIYKDNGSGWIKIGVVRDPVTRLLSAYLDLVHTWPSGSKGWSSPNHDPQQPHRRLRGDRWNWFDAIIKHRDMMGDNSEEKLPEAGEHRRPRTVGENEEREGSTTSGDESRSLQDATIPAVPTFKELLGLLAADIWAAPSAFKPAASLCGMEQSPFDTIIPFETLQVCKGQLEWKPRCSIPGTLQLRRMLNTR